MLDHKKLKRLIENNPNIAVKIGNGYRLIKSQLIIHCSAAGSYTEINLTSGEKLTVSKKLKELESLLPQNFVRVHRSHMVNVNHIKQISSEKRIFITMTNENKVPMTKDKKKILIQHFKML